MTNITWTLTPLDIDALTDYAKNPRSLTDAQFKQLKTSLDKFGMIDKPIINLDEAHTVIGGHQRLRVLRHEGVKTCECWIPDRAMTEREVEELNIRLNKNTGAWDFDVLANEWDVMDLQEWGFTEFELGINDPTDPNAEWKGMPEFEQENKMGVQSIHVHFKTREDVEKFGELVGQNLTHKTRAIWYPKADFTDMKSELYRNES